MKMKALAVAIGAAVPLVSLASSISVGTAETVSSEYLATIGFVDSPAATMRLGSQYSAGDVVTFTYSATPVATGGVTNAFSFPTTLPITVVTATVAGTNSTTGTVASGAFGFFDASDKSVRYRVTSAPSADAVVVGGVFGTIAVPQPSFNASSIGSADVTVTPSSSTADGTAFDSVSATGVGKLIDLKGTQFKYAVDGLTRTIDVNSDATRFLTGTATSDTLTISVVATTNAGSSSLLATSGTMAVTLTGSFAWVDSNTATNATGIQSGGFTFTSGTLVGVSATAISFKLGAQGGTLAIGNVNDLAIPEQSLALSLKQIYTGGTKTGQASGAGEGKLQLNGSSVTVYAVPSSKAVSNFIWMTNDGATDGEVSITVNDAGTAIPLGVVGTIEAKSEFDVTSAMNDALEAQGIELSGGRVHLVIVTKAPAADIAVSAAYRVGDDRVNLLTSIETDQD